MQHGKMGRRLFPTSATAVTGAVLAGCGGPAPPLRAQPTVLTYAPSAQWKNPGGNWQQFLRPALDHFEAEHPGIRVQLAGFAPGGGYLAELLAGRAPDVFQDYNIIPYLEASHLLVDLNPLLKKDDIPRSTWSSLQLDAFTDARGTFFLPRYMNCAVIAVNLGDLDARGLSYPDPEWTYADAARLFAACTWNSGANRHYGFAPIFDGQTLSGSAGPMPNTHYAAQTFGGSVMDETRLVCTLGDPRVAQALQWWESLFWEGIAVGGRWANPFPGATFAEFETDRLYHAASQWIGHYKFMFMPLPRFPAGRMGWCGLAGHAINAHARDVGAAWALVKFLDAEPWYQRYRMRLLLVAPGMLSLWPEFEQVVIAVAPGFRDRGLHWYAESATKWARPGHYFKYDASQAMAAINKTTAAIFQRKVDLTAGLRGVARQVNAMETAAAAAAAARSPAVV